MKNAFYIDELRDNGLAGGVISPEEAGRLAAVVEDDKEAGAALFEASHCITEKMAGRDFDICSIVNAKSGLCPENCSWCAQSAHHRTNVSVYGLISEEKCVESARESEAAGFKRFSIVTSGRKPTRRELERICSMSESLKRKTGISLCASLGLLDREELSALKQSGISRYHCNLETSASYFGKLCTTHTQQQKLETLRAAAEAGLEVCSGGIIGMGETMEQRLELAFELRDLNVASIPINILHPIKGTPLAGQAPLTEEEILVTIALFRFINPRAYLRLAGGRSSLNLSFFEKALYAGINAAIMGAMLTTAGTDVKDEVKLIEKSYR